MSLQVSLRDVILATVLASIVVSEHILIEKSMSYVIIVFCYRSNPQPLFAFAGSFPRTTVMGCFPHSLRIQPSQR